MEAKNDRNQTNTRDTLEREVDRSMTKKELERINEIELKLIRLERRNEQSYAVARGIEKVVLDVRREVGRRLEGPESLVHVLRMAFGISVGISIIVGLTYIGQFIWS